MRLRSLLLGDVVELKRGYDLPLTQRCAGPVPVISSSGKSGSHDRAMVKAPGVVTGRYGTLGEVFFVEQDFWPLNTTLYVKDFKGNDPKFISYFLRTVDLLSCSDKAAVPGLNRNHLHLLPVELPEAREQRAIACILGALDDKIELNRRTNETLEAMARALFQSWFVDFDPVRAKMEGRQPEGMDAETAKLFPSKLIDSPGNPRPAGWKDGSVGEVVSELDGEVRTGPFGTMLQAREYSSADEDGAVPVIAVRDIRIGHLETDARTPRVSSSTAERLSVFRVAAGDILFGRKGAVDRFAVVEAGQDGWVMGSDCIRLRVPSIIAGWLRHVLLLPAHREWMVQHATGTTMPSLNQGIIERIPLIWPGTPLASRFDQLTAAWHTAQVSNRNTARYLASLRDALLPKLLSGELRVPEAEKAVSAVL